MLKFNFDFYFRTSEALEFGIKDKKTISNIRQKSLINFIVLKSQRYKESVKNRKQLSIDKLINEFEKENVPYTVVFRAIIKFLIHYFFWILSKFKLDSTIKYDYLIKTYVDVEYNLFRERVSGKKTLVAIFPFPLSMKRQIKHVINMYQNKSVDCVFIGIPYSASKLIKFILTKKQVDLFELEYDGYSRLNILLQKYKFCEYLNMDDYDPFSVLTGDLLKNTDKKVVTYLHGIGTYSPYISTSELKVFNSVQENYYRQYNKIHTVNYYENLMTNALRFEVIKPGDMLVFYSQVTNNTLFIKPIEERILRILQPLSKRNKSMLYYKPHPNYINLPSYIKEMGIQDASNCNPGKHKIYNASFYSTSFYTEKCDGTFLVGVNEIPSQLLFGEGKYIIKEEELKNVFYI